MDAATWNRYRLRCAKLSEVLPLRSQSLPSVRMTDRREVRGRCALRALLASVRMMDFGAVDFRWGRGSIYNGRRFRQVGKYVTYVGITGS